ncbi:MAG: hypothetical protein ACTSPB_14570 [Candidatus Thorarchaeota archaeon]
MEKEIENINNTKNIAEPISYFLAGSLLIWIIVSDTIEPMGWFTLILGILLVVAGFFSLIIIPFSERITNFRTVFESRFKKYINALVFAITLTTLAVTVIGFHDYTPLFIAGLGFLFIVVIMVIITSWSTVFKNVPALLTVTISLNALAITILFTGANNIQLATVLSLSLIFLFLALNRIAQHTTP